MNHLFAKVNDRKEKYRKLLSDVQVYKEPEGLENAVEYSAAYKLEDDEWFAVSDLSTKPFCIDILLKQIDSTDYGMINKMEPEKIEYLCSYQNENEFYFQRTYQRNMIQQKKYVHIGDAIEIRTAKHGIVINDLPDAVYKKDEDRLYFKRLETITPIFRGIESLYREATQKEVDDFMANSFIKMGKEYSPECVGKANRQRIAMAADTLGRLNKKQKKEIYLYTDKYYPDLKFDGKSFEINNEEDLKNLLYGIEQRFYTTPVTKEPRVANSVSVIAMKK